MSWYITLNYQCLLFWDPRDRDANFSPTPKRSCRQVVTFTFTTLWNHNNVTSQDSRFKSNAKPEQHSRQSVFFKVRYQNEGVLMVIECPTVFSPRLPDISLFLSLSPLSWSNFVTPHWKPAGGICQAVNKIAQKSTHCRCRYAKVPNTSFFLGGGGVQDNSSVLFFLGSGWTSNTLSKCGNKISNTMPGCTKLKWISNKMNTKLNVNRLNKMYLIYM